MLIVANGTSSCDKGAELLTATRSAKDAVVYPVVVVEVEGVRCPALLTSVMVSNRGGDFQLTVEVTRVEKATLLELENPR